MIDLVDFLLARIAEDEEVAHAVAASPIETPGGYWETSNSDYAEITLAVDPARVLAECEAKRRIVAYCTPDDDAGHVLLQSFADPTVDAAVLAQVEPIFRVFGAQMDEGMAYVLRYLALPYAGHPGYREEWRP